MAQTINYVIDACALIAHLDKEEGWECVDELLALAAKGEVNFFMNVVNFLEVYYDRRKKSYEAGEFFISRFHDMAITVIDFCEDDIFYEAGKIKSICNRMSLADAIGLGTAAYMNAVFVTCDHGDLDKYEPFLNIPIRWIRPPKPKKAKIPAIHCVINIYNNAQAKWDLPIPENLPSGKYRATVTLTPEE